MSPAGPQPKGRLSYQGYWADALGRTTATASFGTNGGLAPERPEITRW